MAKKKSVKKEPTVQFAIGAMCGCNQSEADQLAKKMKPEEQEAVLTAYKGGKGRQVLIKIRGRIAVEEKAAKEKTAPAKVDPPATTDKDKA